jgi:hypothetical protein
MPAKIRVKGRAERHESAQKEENDYDEMVFTDKVHDDYFIITDGN